MSTDSHHAIRLAGPWTGAVLVLDSNASGITKKSELRINLTKPDVEAWQNWFCDQRLSLQSGLENDDRLKVVFSRKFNLPTGLSAKQEVLLKVNFLNDSDTPAAVVLANGQEVSEVERSGLVLTAPLRNLRSFNFLELAFSVPVVGTKFYFPPFRSAQLLIPDDTA